MNAPKTPQLIAVRFVTPIQFAGTTDSVRLGPTGNCLSVQPARIEPDLTPTPVDKGQPSQGLLIRGKGGTHIVQSFVPYGNIAEMTYGESK